MFKIIDIRRKRSYACPGKTCDRCKLKFLCFSDKNSRLLISMDELRELITYKRASPSEALKELIGGKIFVSGSRKFKEVREQEIIKLKSGDVS